MLSFWIHSRLILLWTGLRRTVIKRDGSHASHAYNPIRKSELFCTALFKKVTLVKIFEYELRHMVNKRPKGFDFRSHFPYESSWENEVPEEADKKSPRDKFHFVSIFPAHFSLQRHMKRRGVWRHIRKHSRSLPKRLLISAQLSFVSHIVWIFHKQQMTSLWHLNSTVLVLFNHRP